MLGDQALKANTTETSKNTGLGARAIALGLGSFRGPIYDTECSVSEKNMIDIFNVYADVFTPNSYADKVYDSFPTPSPISQPPPQPLKENKMYIKPSDLESLLSVAIHNNDTEMQSVIDEQSSMSEFQQAIVEAKKKARYDAVAKAAVTAMALFEEQQKELVKTVHALRDIRAEEARLLAKITELQKTRAYAEETMNFFPLLEAMGIDVVVDNAREIKLTYIPSDWRPKAPVKKLEVPSKTAKSKK